MEEIGVPNHKQCTKCHAIKSTKEFYKQRDRKNGLNSQCKACFNKQKREYHHRPEVKLRAKLRSAVCYRAVKDLAIKVLGSKCRDCDCTNNLKLAIHHVKGDGPEHRRLLGRRAIFYDIIAHPKRRGKFECVLLCHLKCHAAANAALRHNSILKGEIK